MDKDDDIRLRDQFAMAALSNLILIKSNKAGWFDDSGHVTVFFDYDLNTLVEMAYKIADAMRKARLQSFT